MSPEVAPLVDVVEISRLVGRTSFQRGQGYSRGGAVDEIDWDPESRRLSGRVRGSSAELYRARVSLAEPVGDFDPTGRIRRAVLEDELLGEPVPQRGRPHEHENRLHARPIYTPRLLPPSSGKPHSTRR